MEYTKLVSTADKLDVVLGKIKMNNSTSFVWYSVKGKNGCLFELGGRHVKSGILELKAYIPSVEEGKYSLYQNGFIKSEYSITDYGYLEFPNFSVRHPKISGVNNMLKFLRNTDFKTYYPNIVSKQVVKQYETIYEIKNDKR